MAEEWGCLEFIVLAVAHALLLAVVISQTALVRASMAGTLITIRGRAVAVLGALRIGIELNHTLSYSLGFLEQLDCV